MLVDHHLSILLEVYHVRVLVDMLSRKMLSLYGVYTSLKIQLISTCLHALNAFQSSFGCPKIPY